MKVAIVHDWLDSYRGGERVLEALLELFPEAPVYTLFYDATNLPESITKRQVLYPHWLAPLRRWRTYLLPLFPYIVETFPTEQYELIISSSSCVAKGVLVHPYARHICYVHSPMRYIWDQRRSYLDGKPKILKFFIHLMSTKLRIWDQVSSARVDHLIANSQYVKRRIQKNYGRDATVIHPPVNLELFNKQHLPKSDYLLIAGAFVPYKRMDLAIEACNRLGVRLIVAGSGPEEARLRSLAGTLTEFAIHPSESHWVELFQRARGFLFPGAEDFGITAIEALASGTPVIAFAEGGAMDYIQHGQNGVFFREQSISCLEEAIKDFETMTFEAATCRRSSLEFEKAAFKQKISQIIGAEESL